MSKGEAILRFSDLSFEFGHNHPILDEVNFSLRRGTKVTLMGQNGAGKSTIFKLITGAFQPEDGEMHMGQKMSIATAPQVIPRDELELTVRAFFEKRFDEKVYDIDPRIDKILAVVNVHAPYDKIIREFSGGQQARLLLASALIQNPDLLLLDEPTNNLDKEGIEHLTKFLKEYKKTCMVISHDSKFLNAFTHGVLYLDVRTRKVEQYDGDYSDVVKEITARVEKERRKNAQFEKEIQAKKDKANFFGHKGGQMRVVAKRMREKAAEMEDAKVEVRQDDKEIRKFRINSQGDYIGDRLSISSFTIFKDQKEKTKKAKIVLKKNQHLLLTGPNGIGKSTLLEHIANNTAKGITIGDDIRIGYYRQDFSTLDFNDTVYESLESVMKDKDEQTLRSTASSFLIDGDLIYKKIETLSEGQKGLVSFARLVLQKPGLLILDEPTNHINFRHLPIIAEALSAYDGAMILVSHVPEFIAQIRIDEILDLNK
ncbi:hypothetical protein COB55_01110 [Candidatus Wolfebacteria bacterium]|nr:MAG: hypothetical protein COB55_01110 [Candidatus Wolfebacteria bacterium]